MSGIIDVRPLGAPPRLRLYSAVNNISYACTYYRIQVPFYTAQDIGEADHLLEEFSRSNDEDFRNSSDIILIWMMIGDNVHDYVDGLRKNGKPKFHPMLKKWIEAPRTVFDADDDAEYVDPFNPRFEVLGTIAPDDKTRMHPDGMHSISIELEDGTIGEMWADGKPGPSGGLFDLQGNLDRVQRLHEIPRACTGVTVSTPELKKVYEERYRCKNVYVFPNSIRFDDYPRIPLRRDRRTVTLMWQGGHSHFRDVESIAKSLGRISRKYEHVRFMFWGHHFKWMANQIPRTRYEFVPWVSYDAYKLRLATLDFDINLAPLADRVFNRSKSAIKFYEAAALHSPRPTIAANVGPYKEIIDGETGMLYDTIDEFEEKLCTLIENATLRKTLAENAKDWIKEHRDAFITVPPLLEWYRSLHYDG